VGAELNITAATVEPALSKKTRAIIVPHLFGNPADIGSITDLVKGRNIHVIDDAAQALGAAIDGRPVGSLGDVGIISFITDLKKNTEIYRFYISKSIFELRSDWARIIPSAKGLGVNQSKSMEIRCER
jgi:hypothetical protein